MNEDIFKGKWNQLKGKVKEKWGKLTDDDLTRISGKRDQLLGSLQQRYGWEKDRAQKELDSFEEGMRDEHHGPRRGEPNLKEHYNQERDEEEGRRTGENYNPEDEKGEDKHKKRKAG